MFVYSRIRNDPDGQTHCFGLNQTEDMKVGDAVDIMHEAADWCIENFESQSGTKGPWTRSGHCFWIRDQDHAFAFRMRWC